MLVDVDNKIAQFGVIDSLYKLELSAVVFASSQVAIGSFFSLRADNAGNRSGVCSMRTPKNQENGVQPHHA
jgi:hypothetical protein